MGETRQAKKEAMAIDELAEAMKVLDLEYDRVMRVYDAARTVRCKIDSLQHILVEMVGLDARRTALAAEVGTLEARLIELKGEVGKAEAQA